jgi:hypothetical protein
VITVIGGFTIGRKVLFGLVDGRVVDDGGWQQDLDAGDVVRRQQASVMEIDGRLDGRSGRPDGGETLDPGSKDAPIVNRRQQAGVIDGAGDASLPAGGAV